MRSNSSQLPNHKSISILLYQIEMTDEKRKINKAMQTLLALTFCGQGLAERFGVVDP